MTATVMLYLESLLYTCEVFLCVTAFAPVIHGCFRLKHRHQGWSFFFFGYKGSAHLNEAQSLSEQLSQLYVKVTLSEARAQGCKNP